MRHFFRIFGEFFFAQSHRAIGCGEYRLQAALGLLEFFRFFDRTMDRIHHRADTGGGDQTRRPDLGQDATNHTAMLGKLLELALGFLNGAVEQFEIIIGGFRRLADFLERPLTFLTDKHQFLFGLVALDDRDPNG